MAQRIVPNLWFDGQAEEAAAFYCSIFPDSRIVATAPYPEGSPGEAGTTMTVEFELDGERIVAINGGPVFSFSPAVSLAVTCKDQAEVDHYWERLTDGGTEVQCGWLTDRFGLSWQVVPEGMDEVFSSGDPAAAARAFAAMEKMKKLDLAELRAAAAGVPVG